MYEGKSSWKGKVENRQVLVFRVVQRHLKVRQKVGGGGQLTLLAPPLLKVGRPWPPRPPLFLRLCSHQCQKYNFIRKTIQ